MTDKDIKSWQLCRPSYHQTTGDFLYFTVVPRPVFVGTDKDAISFFKNLGNAAPVLKEF